MKKNKNVFNLIVVLFFLSCNLLAQVPCVTVINGNSTQGTSTQCSNLLTDFIPNALESPIEINLNIIVFKPSSGPGNYGSPSINDANYLVSTANGVLSSIPQPAIPVGAGYILDSKIRLVLKNYQVITDDETYYNLSLAPQAYKDQNAINLYFGYCQPGSPCGGYVSNLVTKDIFFPAGNSGSTIYDKATTLCHEIGHALGLNHSTSLEPFSNVQKNFGCCDLLIADDYYHESLPIEYHTCNDLPPGYTNNLMAQNAGCNYYLSPLQAAIMHYHLRVNLLDVLTPASQLYVTNTNSFFNVDITSSQTWSGDRFIKGNITVKQGATLTIQCHVMFTKAAKVKVEKGAQLIISGAGTATNLFPLFWKGIEVDGTISQNQNYSGGYAIYQGIVQVLNGGTVTKAQCGITTGTTDINGNFDYNSSGGIVIGSSANFINNQKDVAFLYYHNSTGNKSFFDLCNFKTNNSLVNNILPDCRVSLYEVDGVLFRGCNFEYNAGSAYANNNKGKGIYSIDASYSVDQYCGTRCTNPVKSTFLNLTEGVYADNSNPLRVVSVKNSNFYDVINNSTYYNTITTPVFENNYVRTASYGTGTGLYLNNCKLYNVRNNTFLQNTSLINGGDVGIYANNSQAGAHKIYRNSFANFAVGIAPLNNNSGVSNTTDGLKMNCNDFTPIVNGYDVAMMGTSPTVMSNQGNIAFQTATNVVRNIYGATSGCSTCENRWYIVGTSAKTINHGAKSDANTKPLPQPANGDIGVNVVSGPFTLDYVLHCPALETSGGGGTNPNRLASINNQIKKVSENIHASARGTNPSEQNYNFELQALLAEKLNYFLTDSLGASQDSVISLLTTYKNELHESDVLLTYAYINKGDFASANINIDNYGAGKRALGLFQKRLIALHQHPKKAMALNNNLVDKGPIINFSAMDAEWSGGAKAILKYATGQDYEIQRLKPLVENGVNKSYNQNENGVSNSGASEFKTYPNPADKSVNFVYKTQSDVAVTVILTNALGSVVGEYQVKPGSQLEINLEHLPAAVYFLTAYDGKKAVYQTKVMHLK